MPANLTTKLGQLVDVLTPDTTNTRIGVANASPTRTLDVTGTFGASGASTLGGALTYGGITLSNAVTGTGNMMLSISPTTTGTLTAATANFSNAVVMAVPNAVTALSLDSTSGSGSLLFKYNGTQTAQLQALSGGGLVTYVGSSPTEAARINSSGNLLVGTTDNDVALYGVGVVKARGGFTSKTGGSKALAASNVVSNVIEIGSYNTRTCFLITWINLTSSGAGNAQYGTMLVYLIGAGDSTVLGSKATTQYAGYRGDPSVTWAVASAGGTNYLTAYCTNASFSSTLSYQITMFAGNEPTFL